MKDEESFPRGRSSSTKPALRKVKDKLFKKYKKPKKKTFKNSFFEENQIKGKFKKVASARIDDLEPSHTIRPLTYQSLEEGMVVMGRIREISPYHLFICLPGKLSARVPITAISEPYSSCLDRLQKLEITQKDCPPLSELFTEGQAVVCSIIEVKKDGNVLAVNASLDPTFVNKERSHYAVRAGHTLVAAVRTVEDHGYTLHTGIAGLTAFLKFGNATKYVELRNQGRSLVVGEVVRCLVTKCTTTRSASRAEVTLDPKVMADTVMSDGNTQTLHPGTTVSCIVQESSKAGLVVNIGQSKGYVEAAQLPNCWSSPKFVQLEDELTATVIYSLPNTDFRTTARPTYLTLKDLSRPILPKLAIGDMIEAKVTASGARGLILCLGEKKDKDLGNKGFVSVRRLGEMINKESIAKKFSKGTVVTTKILGFDSMEEIYNCTLERGKLEQHYVSVSQAKVGDRVSCRVTEVEALGLKLVLGPVRLYAFKEHLADEPCDNPQKHFSAGDIVDARVLKTNLINRQVYVTLKETLIRSPPLTSYEMAKRGDCYFGTVWKVNENNSLYVTFYNNVAGILHLGDKPSSNIKVGQLVKCYIAKVDAPNRKLSLSLTEPMGGKTQKKLTVGQCYQVVVSNVTTDYLQVSSCDFDGIEGLIPKCHLQNPNQFLEGDFIKAWLYRKKDQNHFFSPNPGIEYFFKNRSNIKYRYRMTCCVNWIGQGKVAVLTSLPDVPVVEVANKEWPDDEQPSLHQLVRLYVSEYNPERKILKLTSKKPPKHPNDTNNQASFVKPIALAEQKSSTDNVKKNSKRKENKSETKEESDMQNQVEGTQDGEAQSKYVAVSQKVPKAPKTKERQENPSEVKTNSQNLLKIGDNSNLQFNDLGTDECSKGNTAKKIRGGNDFKENVQEKSKVKKRKQPDNENEWKEIAIKSEDESVSEEVTRTGNASDLKNDSDDSTEENLQSKKRKDSESMKGLKEEGKDLKSIKKRKSSESYSVSEKVTGTGNESDLNTSDFDSDDSTEELLQSKKRKDSESMKGLKEEDKDVKSNKKRKSSESESDTNQETRSDKQLKKRKSSVSDEDTNEEPKENIKKQKSHLKKPKPTLSETGFLWDIKPEDLSKPSEDAIDDNDEDEEDSKKQKKKNKTAADRRQAAKEEEARLRQVEQTLLVSENNPQSVDQFDRAVLARPDDDELWIKYMSHHLQATEIEKARAVARRALQTINQRLEVERLNVWIALLNLENLFGTQETLKSTLDEALRTNDEFTVFSKMLNIYSQSNKAQEAEQLVHTMLRKFRDSLECWVVSCSALMGCGLTDKARNLLQRAISILPTKQHVNLLCKFALLENQHGNSEQAQTLFEHILTTYPKRTDIWNVYVDMLVKSEKVNVARQILERATKQKLPPKKMKMLFNKWISFEEKNGTPEKVEHVRKQALEYVNNMTNKLDQ